MPKMFTNNLYKVSIITYIEAGSRNEALKKAIVMNSREMQKCKKVKILEEFKALERTE